MKEILLICNQGMSTSFLVKKMQDIANEQNLEVHFHAESETKLSEIWQAADAILLGPQISYLLDFVKQTVKGERPVEAISPIHYGRSDADAVLKQALSMLEGR